MFQSKLRYLATEQDQKRKNSAYLRTCKIYNLVRTNLLIDSVRMHFWGTLSDLQNFRASKDFFLKSFNNVTKCVQSNKKLGNNQTLAHRVISFTLPGNLAVISLNFTSESNE